MKLLFITLLTILMLPVFGQDITHNISKRDADSLFLKLNKSKPDTIRIEILLKLAQFNIFKPGEFQADLDSAALFIEKANQLNARLNSPKYNGYISLVQSYLEREKRNVIAGRISAEKSIRILKTTNDKYHLGLAYFELAQYFDYRLADQFPEKDRLTNLAIVEFRQSGNVELMAFSLKTLADVCNCNNQTSRALHYAELSLQAYQSIHYKQLQGIYDLLGSIYFVQADFMQALNFELQALKTANAVGDTTMQLCEINSDIGLVFFKANQNKKAIVYFKRALEIAEKYHDNSNVILLLFNIANNYVMLNEASVALHFFKSIPKEYLASDDVSSYYHVPLAYLNIYTSLKKFRAANSYSLELLRLVKSKKPGVQVLNNIYLSLIRYDIASGQYGSALNLLNKNKIILDSLEDPLRVARNYDLWFRLDTSQRNYASAVQHLLMYNRINDSIVNRNKNRRLKEIEALYAVKKEDELQIKDRDIRILKQKNQIQQVVLKHANLLKDVTIAGILLSVLIIILMSRQYRLKQKNNKEITHKNQLLENLLDEKEWLLKEVHHRVKNNLHTVICLLESQAAYLKSDALKAVENSQHRIYAMSLIHQKLYQSDDIKTIDIAIFIPELIQYLKDSFGVNRVINFQLDIESLKFGISQAVPLALIINEAVSNSIKFAFPSKRPGTIAISIHQKGDEIKIILADNGVGMYSTTPNAPNGSLGLKLIKGLSEDLNGHIIVEDKNGVSITITFEVDPLNDNNSPLTVFEKRFK